MAVFVAFSSAASTLVAGVSNGTTDAFVHDRSTGQTTRVSVSSSGTQGNGTSVIPSLSPDGRYVAFQSAASNLVSGDTNLYTDIFVHDRVTAQTTRISVSSAGVEGNNKAFIQPPSTSGRFVAFESFADNLVTGDTNGVPDVFVHDLQELPETVRVSLLTNGNQSQKEAFNQTISADGRYVTYSSSWNFDLNTKRDVFVFDRQTSQVNRVSAHIYRRSGEWNL